MKNDLNIDELQEIWNLVGEKHHGQKYGGPKADQKIEYINHIGSVFFEIINAANAEPELDVNFAAKCALLHDTLEDTDLGYKTILAKYGEQVAKGVQALTKNENLSNKQEKMADSLERIKHQPKEVWAVKLADRICNLYSPPFYWDNKKKEEYLVEAGMILKELGSASNYLATRLKQKIEVYRLFL